jgi:hypothetical protein
MKIRLRSPSGLTCVVFTFRPTVATRLRLERDNPHREEWNPTSNVIVNYAAANLEIARLKAAGWKQEIP